MTDYKIVAVSPIAPGIRTAEGYPVVALLSVTFGTSTEVCVYAGALLPNGAVIPSEKVNPVTFPPANVNPDA
ncbi:hypothetical protein [Mycolicibacterium fallax]|uniref:Uncharacterized protein n=1 Tax=Mycolicibacterium fallax TaxID=1793 RepID=A0A1X1RJ30_MYCFA|nr:hypothetical protein [Mycolicibacterium fallax]ORV07542.1 hypothetical protein AWC04_03780 [Mycolicibacterium fallax]BBY99456.1 hypothetical protein MFAL_29230 [Mycolicibacterium fallax]